MNKKTYYFSHDSNAHQDAKIKAMISVYGAEGYGWYWILIEIMRQQDEYKLSISRKYDVASIASSLPNCPKEKCTEFLEDCINEFDLFMSDGEYFWSESLVRRMMKVDDIVEKRKAAVNTRWGKVKQPEIVFDVEPKEEEVEVKTPITLDKVKNIDLLHNLDAFKLFTDELRLNEDFKYITDKYFDVERQKAIDWIKANGKVKKDYRAFFRTWIRNNYTNPQQSISNQNKPRIMHL